MKNGFKKELLLVLILTLSFGVLSFFIAKEVDETVSEVNLIRNQIEELTRIAVEKEYQIREIQDVEFYKKVFYEELPGVDEIINILNQIESIGTLTNTTVTIKLEEGVVGPDDIEFSDEEEKNDFLNKLVLKEFNPSENDADQNTGTQSSNVVLQMIKEAQEAEARGDVKISYLDVDLSVLGTYESIRTFIDTLQLSKYYFNISEIRLNKTDEGNLSGNIRIRAFIFEE